MHSAPTCHSETVEPLRFAIDRRVDLEGLPRDQFKLDYYADDLVAQLVYSVYGRTMPAREVSLSVRVPASWWQHFKQAWFPYWARRRWPVLLRVEEQKVEINNLALYPNLVGKGARFCQNLIYGPIVQSLREEEIG